MTTYQRLKAENLKLKQELDIASNDDSLEAIIIKNKYKLLRWNENYIWKDGIDSTMTRFQGFLKSIE